MRMHAIVGAGGKIELSAPSTLREGDEVEVVLMPIVDSAGHPHLLDVLDSLPKGLGNFKSAEDVDEYLRTERDSWER
jgi:hypothetical protein